MTLFLVMDPLGNVPLFLAALRNVAPARRRFVLTRELLIALGVMAIILFLGRGLMELLHVTQPALATAGGVILLLIAIRMVFPSPDRPLAERVVDEPFIVPLAVPYVAGPSVLAIEIVLMQQMPGQWPLILLALVIAWAVSSAILLASSCLHRFLGERTLLATERLMGMILVIIAVQMMLGGIRDFFA
nr:MarC family protein [Brooklawnia cerclae]